MHRIQTVIYFAVAASICLGTAPVANAVPIQTPLSSTSQTGFDANISNVDLIRAGAPTLAGTVVATGSPTFAASGSNDGVANGGSGSAGLTYWGTTTGTESLTYNLTGSATGYDITTIRSIYGWQDSRGRHAAQRYTVSYTTVSNPAFTILDTVTYDPFGSPDAAAGSTQVTIIDSVARLATGVTAIRFTMFDDPNEGGNEVGVLREFDVFGVATAAVPEPTSIALWSLLGLGLAGVGYRRLRCM